MIRLTPRASGSGIRDVVPVTFVGGLPAIGGGMVLGREAPTAHMGSVAGAEVGRWFRLTDRDRRLLHVALVGLAGEGPPIYDLLRRRMLAALPPDQVPGPGAAT